MRRFADPTRCPGCSTALSPGSLVCAGCRLDLGHPLASELFTTLQRADVLVDTIRVQPRAMGVVAPARPETVEPSVRRGPTAAQLVRASSVPAILLGLGAVCLLVAALVFLAVTWSEMGVGGRTATLLVLTLTVGLLTAWAARAGLRGATEALGVVTLGLAVLDLYGADNAGWFGDPSAATLTVVVGAFLVVAGVSSATVLGRTPAAGFVLGELAVVGGALLVSGGLTAQGWGAPAGRVLLATVLLLVLAAGVWRLVRVGSNVHRVAAWGLVPVAALDWLALLAAGLDDLGTSPTVASAWGRLEAWPLVAAAALAVLVAAARRLPLAGRLVVAAAGLVPFCLAVLAPVGDEPTATVVLAVVALSVALVALMVTAPRPWGAVGLAAGGLCALGLTVEVLTVAAAAIEQYAATATAAWSGTAGGRIEQLGTGNQHAAWLLPVCVATVVALVWAAARLTAAGRSLPWRAVLRPAAVVLAVSGVATLILYPVPVWTVLVVALAVSVAAGWPALTGDDAVAAAVGGTGLVGTVVLSWYDEHLSAVTLLVAMALVLVVHLRTRSRGVAAVAGALTVALLADLVWTAAALAGTSTPWAGVATLLALSAFTLGRHLLPVGVRTGRVHDVLALAAGSVAGLVAAAAVADAPLADQPTWTAVHLTIAGACATALALVRRDRRAIGWLGGVLLVAATWVRLEDLGVEQPEPYTLPTALVLLALGLARLRRDPAAGTVTTLGAGLGLALTPSLLWVLEVPTGLRAVLLGLACLGLVVGGVRLRWCAPMLFGGAVGLVLVLREAAPYLGDTVPRWALIGAAGALLIALGVTWERRLQDARLVSAYVHGLR